MRMKQKKVYLLSGAPGCGKTTWCEQQIEENGGVHCSRDKIRFSLLKEGEDYFEHEDEVVNLWLEEIRKAIENPEVENVYIDSTNLSEKARSAVIKNIPAGDYELIIVIFRVPLRTCLERNEKREGLAQVPSQVIKDMYSRFAPNSMLGDRVIFISEGEE